MWQRLTRGIRERTAKPETGTPLMIFHWKTLGVAALALVLILVGLFWWRGAQNGGIRPVQDVVIIPPDQTSPEPEPPAPPKPKEPEEPQEPERTEGPPSVDPAPPPTPEEAGEEKGPPRTGPRAPSPPAEERQPKTEDRKPKTPLPGPPTRGGPEVRLAQVEVGQFTEVMGQPQVGRRGEEDSQAATPGTPVYLGDHLQTGDADQAAIRFHDGSRLKLHFNTTLEIPAVGNRQSALENRPSRPRPSEIRLLLGHLWTQVGKLGPGGRFEVITPVATAAVRGTQFELKVRKVKPEKDSSETEKRDAPAAVGQRPAAFPLEAILTVQEGVVEFFNAQGREEATARTESIARKDTKPTKPRFLPYIKLPQSNWYFMNRRLTLPGAEARLVLPETPPQRPGVPPSPEVSPAIAEPLEGTTRRWLEGTEEGQREGKQALQRLLENHPHAAAVHNNLGVLYEIQDEMEGALRHYQQAVQAQPGVALYHFNRGQVLKNIGNLERAAEELATAVRLAPQWEAVRQARILVYGTLGRNHEALAEAEEWLRLNPQSSPAWRHKGFLLWRQGRREEARQAAQQALECAPDNVDAYLLLGLLSEGKAAEEMYRKALELDPHSAAAYSNLGKFYGKQGQRDQAEEMFLKAIELQPHVAIDYRNLAIFYRKQGKLEKAEEMYLKSIEIDPDDAASYYGLGNLYQARKEWEKAEEQYLKAIQRGPGYASAYNNLGALYCDFLHQYDEAEKMFRKVLELDPDSAKACSNLGSVYRARGDLKKAEEMYRKAIQIQPDYAFPYINLSKIYQGRGQLLAAVNLVLRAMKLDDRRAMAGNNLAWHLAQRGLRLDDALTLAQRAVQLGRRPLFLDTLGWVHYQRGEYAEAEAALQEAFDESQNVEFGKHLRQVYVAQGETAEAEQVDAQIEGVWKGAIEKAPDDPNVYRRMAGFYRERGQLDEAAQAYRQMIERDSQNGCRYWCLGSFLLLEQRNLDEAEKVSLAGVEAAPGNGFCYTILALIYRIRGQLDQAQEVYRGVEKTCRQSLQEDPTNYWSSYWVAWSLAERGVYLEEALALLQPGLKAKPEQAWFLDTLGWVYAQQGELKKAEEVLKKVLETNWKKAPMVFRSWAHLGWVYEQQGNPPGAMEAYRQVLELVPDHPDAKVGLERLEKEP